MSSSMHCRMCHYAQTRRETALDTAEWYGVLDQLAALPLTPSTTDLIDKAFFDAAKRGHIFINVGRGQTVVTADLVAALEDGRVGAAGLAVTEPEPLPADHPLWRMESVIITPHIAGRAGETERHATLLKENLARFVAGDALYNVVDPARGY